MSAQGRGKDWCFPCSREAREIVPAGCTEDPRKAKKGLSDATSRRLEIASSFEGRAAQIASVSQGEISRLGCNGGAADTERRGGDVNVRDVRRSSNTLADKASSCFRCTRSA